MATPAQAPSLHILAVDDEPAVLKILSACLTWEGHTVETAADGIEGWQRFQSGTWDMVLTDRMMPGMTGEQLAAAIKQVDPDIPVVMITGMVAPSLADARANSPIDVVVRKPFTLASIRAAIEEARSRHLVEQHAA